MVNARKGKSSKVHSRWGNHDHKVFLLQGGGGLGAYQAGVYAALQSDLTPGPGTVVHDYLAR